MQPHEGDCAVAELDRLRNDLRCASAVHFVGDIHQPLHTVLADEGGNLIEADLFMRGLICTDTCIPAHTLMSFHAAWDTGLIQKALWNWGAYVDRLRSGWLAGAEAALSDRGHPPGLGDRDAQARAGSP